MAKSTTYTRTAIITACVVIGGLVLLSATAGAGAIAADNVKITTGTETMVEGDDIDINATKILEDDPEEFWETVTELNWGYEAMGLETFHEEVAPDNRGEGLDIVIIDRGFDLDHPVYNDVEGGEPHQDYHVNVVNSWCPTPFEVCDIEDADSGHGTAVTGAVWQVAPNANYHILDPTPLVPVNGEEAIESAWEEAESINPDVIVSSVGPFGDQEDGNDGTSDISQAANDAAAGDTIAVAAAGQNIPDDGWLCEFLGWCDETEVDYPVIPGDAENVLSVSQTLSQRQDGELSQLMPSQNVEYVLNNNPTLAAPGSSPLDDPETGIVTLAPMDADTQLDGIGPRVGTSLAAPQVAGVAALLTATHDADGVEDALKSSGIVTDQFPTSVETEIDGDGRVSILGAYDHLSQDVPKPEPDVSVGDKTVEEDGASFSISLQNVGGSSSMNGNGVMINKDSISITNINTGGFDDCLAGTAIDGCDVTDGVPSDVVELYTDDDAAISGIITAEYDGEPAEAAIEYRGWIYDDTSAVINPVLFDHEDDSVVRATASYEPYITRYPSENTEGLPTADNPSEFTASDNPPYARAAHDDSFDITDYETEFESLSPVETSVTASPDAWDLGSIDPGSTHSTEITLENTGEIDTGIDISAGSGLSVSGTPDELAAGAQDSFELTLDASNYGGDSVTIGYAGGSFSIPISATIVDDGDLLEEDWQAISDPHPCIWAADIWGEYYPITCDDQDYMDWIDQVDFDEEVLNALVDVTLTVEVATEENDDEQENPVEVLVNGEYIDSIESPPGGGEFETHSISVSTDVLQEGENEIKLTTSESSAYKIGGDTQLDWEYFSPPELDLDLGTYPEEVEPGETFLLPATVENEGGQVAEDVQLGTSDFDGDKLTIEDWPDTFGPGVERDLEPLEVDSGYFEIVLEEETTAGGEVVALADNIDFSDWPDESFTVQAPNDPPSLVSFETSDDEVEPNNEITYSATVDDPDDSEVEVTLEVYQPGDGNWETYETKTVEGQGTVEFTETPFSGDDIGEDAQYRFEYEDEFENSGKWGSFSGPTIVDPNPDGPSFDDWQYPTVVEYTEDIEINSNINDESGISTVNLTYEYPDGNENQIPMNEDSGDWVATLPAPGAENINGTLTFTVTATDNHPFPETSTSITRGIDVVEDIGIDVTGDGNPAQDLNGDGLYEDIDGDGGFDIFDVQALFNGLDNDAVQNHPEMFNFNEDDNPESVTIFDVQGLFNRLVQWDG